jgi:deazaflavin-dependent oxidoreductase (nitroreductase family)
MFTRQQTRAEAIIGTPDSSCQVPNHDRHATLRQHATSTTTKTPHNCNGFAARLLKTDAQLHLESEQTQRPQEYLAAPEQICGLATKQQEAATVAECVTTDHPLQHGRGNAKVVGPDVLINFHAYVWILARKASSCSVLAFSDRPRRIRSFGSVPSGHAVLTTTGRKTGKPRHKVIRAIPHGDRVYIVQLRPPVLAVNTPLAVAAWVLNIRADPHVQLKLDRRTYAATMREPAELAHAREIFCEPVHLVDYPECVIHLKGRPSARSAICTATGSTPVCHSSPNCRSKRSKTDRETGRQSTA